MASRKVALSLALGSLMALVIVGSALASHALPGSGSPLRVPLVPAYKNCPVAGADSIHVAPVPFPSCTTSNANFGLQSDILTMASAGVGSGSGSGFISLKVGCLASSTEAIPPCTFGDAQEEEDIAFELSVSDVQCQKVAPGCTGAGDDYTGQLYGTSLIRITDHSSPATCLSLAGTGCGNATTIAGPFPIPTPPGACVVNGSATTQPGSTCGYASTINTVVPGAVKEGQRGIVSILNLQVKDQGEDGDIGYGVTCPPSCGTADDTVFVDQGIFLP